MHTKANKPWLGIIVSFTIGLCIGAVLVLSKEPQQVVISTQSQGRCAIKHNNATHIQNCQILRKDLAYIEHQW